jgi:hypothetical protein
LYVRRDETFCMEEGGQQDGVEEQFWLLRISPFEDFWGFLLSRIFLFEDFWGCLLSRSEPFIIGFYFYPTILSHFINLRVNYY